MYGVNSMNRFEDRYPYIAAWVQDGIVEIGYIDDDSSFIRVLDEGGMIWSSEDAYPSLDSALEAADAAIAEWCRVHIPDLAMDSAASTLPYTPKQGQYLAYIHQYSQLNGQAPAEHEIQAFFGVTPPTVHQMILKLEQLGFISRIPRQARSIKVLVAPGALPPLGMS